MLGRFLKTDRGARTLEYGLVASLVSLASLAAFLAA
jgi:Flp pilus assembly pilin Flp